MTPGFSVCLYLLVGFLHVSSHQKTLCMQMPEVFSEKNRYNSSFCTSSYSPQFYRKWLQWLSLGSNVSLFSVTCTVKKIFTLIFSGCVLVVIEGWWIPVPVPVWLLTAWGFPEVRFELFLGESLPWLQAICEHDHKLQNRVQSACVLIFFIYTAQNVLKAMFPID